MKKVTAVLAAMVLGFGAVAGAADLQTTSGTMELGGTAGFTIAMIMPEQGDNQTSYMLSITPTGGYFIMDNLELMGGFSATMFFGDNTDNLPKLVGFMLGARYILKMGSLAPYFGAMVGMDFSIPKEGDTTKNFDISAPIGLLYALNDHVALDMGLRVNFIMGLDDQGNKLYLPIGYFGVQAFF